MDLIDIDQVLDNLELSEQAEEQQRLSLLRANSATSATVATAAATTTNALALNNGYTTLPAAPVETISSTPSVNPSSFNAYHHNVNTKGFIGVSQVFNSLDDYRKNVELLTTGVMTKYDEECRPLKDNNKDTVLEHKSLETIHKNYKEIDELDSSNDSCTESPVHCHRLELLEEEDQASKDIHKFKEKPSKLFKLNNYSKNNTNGEPEYEDDDDEDNETSVSDSLTTSSPSTFSSGPSLGGLNSTPEGPLSPEVGLDEEEQSALLSAEQPQNNEDDKLPGNLEVNDSSVKEKREELGDGEASQEAELDLPKPSLTDNKIEEVEGLAEGLSSISITSVNEDDNSLLRCADASVSSVLDNVLEDLQSETTTTSLLSQMPDKLETDQIVFSPQDQTTQETHQTQEQLSAEANMLLQKVQQQQKEEDELPKQQPDLASHYPQKPGDHEDDDHHKQQQQQQQPLTFCSTMDDISDTELDSMLQEIDIDDEQQDQKHTQNNDVKTSPVDDSLPSRAVLVAQESGDSMEANVDNPNADSFSQASTVEFSEVKANSVALLNESVNEDKQISEAVTFSCSSTTSSTSSLEEEPQGVTETGDVSETATEQLQEEIVNGKPQRPTTLNLPVINPAAYTNAGQTPPELDGTVPQIGSQMPDPRSASGAVDVEASGYSDPHASLGKVPPIWVPDNMAAGCMQCSVKFTVIKRRHHCRACGKVLCSVCCSQKFKLEFLQDAESRVCVQCYLILTQRQSQTQLQQQNLTQNQQQQQQRQNKPETLDDNELRPAMTSALQQQPRSPNPNNPMEYCSTIPPHRQVSNIATPPPTVIVPVGVLKKSDGSYSSNSSNSNNKSARKRKSVMFSDGIAPGSELASSMEQQWGEAKQGRKNIMQTGGKQSNNSLNKPPTPGRMETQKDITTMGLVASLFRGSIPPSAAAATISTAQSASQSPKPASDSNSSPKKETTRVSEKPAKVALVKRLPPNGCDKDGCFISTSAEHLPPLVISTGEAISDFEYQDVANGFNLIERLQIETLKFAIKTNFFVFVKIVNLKCCMNRTVINFTTCGMHYVGNDEVVILLEYEPPESKEQMQAKHLLPLDVFQHLYEIYRESEAGRPISELSYTEPSQLNFLGSREYGGFVFIRITFQCMQEVIVPENPYLCGILIHRHEVPWAKVFPLRLMLRLGAQYRYYPCPHISIRNRESVFAEIAQTIITFLADFRQYSYTLPTIRGMFIHMEDRQTTVMIPRNRLEDVVKAINGASDHILALGGNFSKSADGHLVCMQNIHDDRSEMYSYSTQAINIQGQPRKVTGASFIVFNESLKSTSGLSGKCSIVEDGLMVQVQPAKMEEIRTALKNRDNVTIVCGPVDADEKNSEVVTIKWVDNDRNINIGVKSPIDGMSMEGLSSMRVHASFNYASAKLAIRLTDIFIIKHEHWYSPPKANGSNATVDVTRIAEQVARSASMALVPFLDLLAGNGHTKIGLRTTLHQDNVCFEAGSAGNKLPPLYMNALDNHLIPTLHNESAHLEDEIVLELIFYILNA